MIFKEDQIKAVKDSANPSHIANVLGTAVELRQGELMPWQMMDLVNCMHDYLCSDDPASRPLMESSMHKMVSDVNKCNIGQFPIVHIVERLLFFYDGFVEGDTKSMACLTDLVKASKAKNILDIG